MLNFFLHLSNFELVFILGLFIFFSTSLGSAVVYLFRNINKGLMDYMISLSSGIMMSAAFLSLLSPAIEKANNLYAHSSFIIFISFIFGSFFILLGNLFICKFFPLVKNDNSLRKSISLFISITMHNIPEGLVVGIAVGSYKIGASSLISVLILTLGIALQNFPEGSAISMPLLKENFSKNKAFLFGTLSGIVEPIAAVLGYFLILKIQFILPIIMIITSGAMFYVLVTDMIPEVNNSGSINLNGLMNILGFSCMMFIELLLG